MPWNAKGDTDAAIAEYREAIKLKPGFAEAHNGLGLALQHKGQTDDAIAEYRKAIELKADYQLARDNLARALARKAQ